MVASLIEGVLKLSGQECLDLSEESIEDLRMNMWEFQSCSQ